jgi:hypothetical protein
MKDHTMDSELIILATAIKKQNNLFLTQKKYSMAVNRYNVVVDASLTPAQVNAIDKAIQAAVLQQVAKIDNGFFGSKKDLGPGLKGKYIKNFKTLDALKKNAAFKKI